jgi:hypothetical protein
MRPSPIVVGARFGGRGWLGGGCDGASPFATTDAPSDPSGLPGPAGPSLTGTAEGKVLGQVKAVDPSTGRLTLAGNVRLQITLFSEIDESGDFDTLAEVKAALEAGTPVLCDMDGFVEGGVVVVVRIRFVKGGTCDSCGPGPEGDSEGGSDGSGGSGGSGGGRSDNHSTAVIDGHVQEVDLADKSVTLVGGLKVKTHSGTEFQSDEDCGCENLEDVKKKMEAGFTVNADVRGTIENDGATAIRIRFEIVGGGQGDDSGGEEDEQEKMNSLIVAVDLNARIVTLESGKKLKIATDAVIEAGGLFRTLAEVKAAVDAGLKIRIEADVRLNLEGILEVTRCSFEKEANDSGNDAEGIVTGIVVKVDLLARTCRTSDGKLIRIASDSIIDLSGDVFTLADVALRLTLGIQVRIEAWGTPSANGFLATKARFTTG